MRARPLNGEHEAVTKQRGDKPGEKQHRTVVRRRPPDSRIPEHLEQRIVASHRRLIREPYQRPGEPRQHEPISANPRCAREIHCENYCTVGQFRSAVSSRSGSATLSSSEYPDRTGINTTRRESATNSRAF